VGAARLRAVTLTPGAEVAVQLNYQVGRCNDVPRASLATARVLDVSYEDSQRTLRQQTFPIAKLFLTTSACPVASSSASQIYWGAYIEGAHTYNYLYRGTWSNAPWCDPGTQCPLARFDSNAGKQVSIEHWGMCWTCSFDAGIAKAVVRRGDIPAIDWANDSSAADAAIASGQYDSWLTTQAQAMKAFGHPLFLLFDEEMNGTWYPYSPGQNGNTAASFVAMWRHIHVLLLRLRKQLSDAAPGRSHQADHDRRGRLRGKRRLQGRLDHRRSGDAATAQLPEDQGAALVQLAHLREEPVLELGDRILELLTASLRAGNRVALLRSRRKLRKPAAALEDPATPVARPASLGI
jgi:hypothetical protein